MAINRGAKYHPIFFSQKVKLKSINFITRISLIYFSFILVPINGITAQNTIIKENVIESFFNEIYNFSFIKADSLLRGINGKIYSESIKNSIHANFFWWKILSGDKLGDNIKLCDKYCDKVIGELTNKNSKDINDIINLINTYALKARLDNYIDKNLNSVSNLYKSFKCANELEKTKNTDDKTLLVLGMYYYMSEYIQNEYWFSSVFMISSSIGNKKLGLEYLKKCSKSHNLVIKTEANYFLLKIFTTLEIDYSEALLYANYLHSEYPKNIVFSVEVLKILDKIHNIEKFRKLKLEINSQLNDSIELSSEQKTHFKTIISSLHP